MSYDREFLEAGDLSHALDEKSRAWDEQPPPERFRKVASTDETDDQWTTDWENDFAQSECDWERFN